ncbi:beta-glucosidase [bacterium]|nr:MAG: beta-glucosidase [bacterium]
MFAVAALMALQGAGAPVSLDSRVEDTLAKLTLDEKLSLVSGTENFYTRGVERLGIPRLRMSDGPLGVHNYGKTTAYPAPVGLAASWDAALANRFGTSIGRDGRARGVHIWLGPGMNLARIPMNGRNFEYVGEDPWLAARMSVEIVRGVQSQGVVATIKHYVANDHESDRMNDSSEVDERTLRELYLRPFEASVKEGGAWALMSGYNLTNGVHMAEQSHLIQDVLRKEWGFRGLHMSDWGGARSTLPSALNGLDLEMPGGEYFGAATLKPLVESGKIPMATLDDKIRNLLRMTYAMGFADRPQENSTIPKDDPSSAETALQIAREGIVLLKNDRILPLSGTGRTFVVGPNAAPAVIGGGGSSQTDPFAAVSVADAVKAKFKGEMMVQSGRSDPSDAFKFTGFKDVKEEVFKGKGLEGTPFSSRTVAAPGFLKGQAGEILNVGQNDFSVRWTGSFSVPQGGQHVAVTRSDDGVRLWVDGKLIVDEWHDRAVSSDIRPLNLTAGLHTFKVEYYQGEGDAEIQVGFFPIEEIARRNVPEGLTPDDTVIACVGFSPSSEGEGFDRPFALPSEQQIMLDALVAKTRNIILVVNSGGAVDLSPWAGKVRGIVQAWYPGQNGNVALAEILTGETNPSGKLPASFPARFEGTYYANAYPPKDNKLPYSEGLLMGYRGLDRSRVEPLFPFGFGLSYTRFRLSNLKVTTSEVTLSVQNTGDRAGAEVVQVYIGRNGVPADRPIRELKAFARVELQPGEKRTVTLPIRLDWLSTWDPVNNKWTRDFGKYNVWVGNSSKNLPLKGSFETF